MANVVRVELPGNDGKLKKVSRNIARALYARNFKGMDIDEAAEDAGIKADTLKRALKKPEIIRADDQMFAERQSGARPRAWHGLEGIAFSKDNDEKNRLNALTKVLEYTIGKPGADAGGGSGPAQYVVIGTMNVQVNAGQVAGGSGLLDLIDGQAKRIE